MMLSYIAVGTSAALLSPPLITAVARLISALRPSTQVHLLDTEEEYEVIVHIASAMAKINRRDGEDVQVAKKMLHDSADALDTLYDRFINAKKKHEERSYFTFWSHYDEDKWRLLLNSQYRIVEKRMNLLLKLKNA